MPLIFPKYVSFALQSDCSSKLISIDKSVVIGLLDMGENFPLLRFAGGIEDLGMKVVPFSQTSNLL